MDLFNAARRWRTGASLFALLATVLPSAPLPAAAATSIAGTVTSAAGTPIAGATVNASGPAAASATTDADGAFALTVPPGIYRISVDRGGYQPVSLSDVTVVDGASVPLKVTLSQVDLSSFKTIGTVSATTAGRSQINTGASAQTFVNAQTFQNLASPQLNSVLQRVPDLTIQRLGSQQDTSIIVGGLQPYETQVLIDGHPIALGQYGVWFSQYFPSFMVGGAEVQSGPGNTTPFANIAVGGTVNLTTPGYTTRPTAQITFGDDNYSSQSYSALFTGSLGDKHQLQYVIGNGYSSANGPYFHKQECEVQPDFGTPSGLPGAMGIVQFCGDFSGSFWNRGLLGKLKYNFSPSTSLEFGFTGTYGGYSPQGSAWGTSDGPITIEQCQQFSPLSCGDAHYNNLIGKTVNGFTWYPGTGITNVQELYTAQFRTSLGKDTLVVRPYIGRIQPEFYDGLGEWTFPANFGPTPGSPSYQAPSLPPGTTIPSTGLPKPNNFESAESCPPFGGNYAAAFYLLNSNKNTITTNNLGQEICYQYPYTSYEQDNFYGGTLSYIHPLGGDGFLNFTYDYHGQSTYAYQNDPENVVVPFSANRYSTFSLTGEVHATPQLAVDFGLYNTQWIVSGQQVTSYTTNPDGSLSPVIGGLQRSVSRFDPHIAFVYRNEPSTSYRFAYGSSETFPFVGDVSGPAGCQPFASSSPAFTAGICTEKTPNLQPEYSSAFSLGADHRFRNGAVLSLDVQQSVVHNVFQQLTSSQLVPNPSGGSPLVLGLFIPINAALLNTQLVTLKYIQAPRVGFGFQLQATADRSIVSGIPFSAYAAANGAPVLPANNVQVCGIGQFTPGISTCIPYLKGYGAFSYAFANGAYLSIGADYEGKNNPYYQPPFAVADLTARYPITKDLEFQLSVENLFNNNAFQYLPAPNQGVPVVAETSTDGVKPSYTTYSSALLPAIARTVHFQLRYHIGR